MALLNRWDVSHSGVIDRKGFTQVIKVLGLKASAESIDKLFDGYITTEQGTIELGKLARTLSTSPTSKASFLVVLNYMGA